MKKLLIGLLVVVVVAGAAWSGLWYTGRGEVSDQMDLELARLEASGTTVTWQERKIGGFPFGYEVVADRVAITNRDNGILVRIPQVVSQADASDIDRIETRLVGEIQIDVPLTEELRESDPRLPKVVNFQMTGDGLSFAVEGLTSGDRRYVAAAQELALKLDQEDLPNRVDLKVSGLSGNVARDAETWTSGTQLGQFSLLVDGTDEEGRKSEFELEIGTFSVTTTADLPPSADLKEILFGTEKGSVEIAYSAGTIGSRALTSDSSGGGGTLRYNGSAGTGVVGIQNGTMEVRAESRQNAWSVEPSHEASDIRGTVQAEAVQAYYKLPTAPTETPQPAGLRIAVIGLDGDEEFWNSLDPGAVLDRSNAEMLVDVEATAKVTDRLDKMRPTGRLPLALSNISVNALNLSALGAEAQASGDVEILQPINLPLGAVDIRVSKAFAVLNGLMRAGLIDEPTWTTATAMLQVYARPGEGDDVFETELTFENEGIFMNGLRVQ